MARLAFFCFVFISFLACESREEVWSEKELQVVIDDAEEIGSFALLVQADEEIVASFGDALG